ncbi:DUF3667 domain-containing protein [Mucilaginibacter sp. Bleaf8]|uniref:DUF3667 domain-containing protein n=1 Tax=Mucilaginibacter sp. Bleaf8 TaxID=2834430 RepID=UPI001BCB35CC|nr:DUF3667 domain-containing protein [Mucilaginibacter sp. Bleaf8]MBS7563355.1 DUF3667 domain-containing protein [Mucilaginibacter sp. Bleaf8]
MKKHYRHENDCLNCGTELGGKFCHHCGQENLQIKESFGHMLNHAVSDYFHFDHQFFHTLRPLFLKPGKLTNEYMAGRRAQYLHPVKMYIFISLVYFLLLFKVSHSADAVQIEGNSEFSTEQQKEINEAIAVNPMLSAKQKQSIQQTIESKQKDKKVKNDEGGTLDHVIDGDGKAPKTYESYLEQQKKLSAKDRDGWIQRMAVKKAYAWSKKGKSSEEIKEAFWEALLHNIPKMMFIMLPLFALLLKLAFYKNKKFYVEHLIYSIHLHCFLFLFLAALMLLQMALPEGFMEGLIILFAIGVIGWYVFRSLKTVYHRSSIRTFTKMSFVTLTYAIVFMIGFITVLAITVATGA